MSNGLKVAQSVLRRNPINITTLIVFEGLWCGGSLHLSSVSVVEVISYLFVSLSFMNGSLSWR